MMTLHPTGSWFSLVIKILLDREYIAKIDFDEYGTRYQDVKKSGINPALHYLKYGINEQRTINLKKGFSTIRLMPLEEQYPFRLFKLTLDNQNLSAYNSKLKQELNNNERNIFIIFISATKALLLPESNLNLFASTSNQGILWPLLPSGDLSYTHLIDYKFDNDKILIKPFAACRYLNYSDVGLKNRKENSDLIQLGLANSDIPLPVNKMQTAIISHILAGQFKNISILQFNKILIDIILQVLPFEKWDAARLGIDSNSIKSLTTIYSHSTILGKIHSLSGNRLELSQDYDWLAKYYGYAGGRSWGAAHSLHHIWRRSFHPTKRICLLTSARNEGPYILEFVAYYKALGIDGIFIYSNDNEDGSEELLEALATLGEIYYIKNHQGNVGAQAKSFAHALSINQEILDYEWCLLIDMDEFLWVNPKEFNNINEFLEFHEQLSSKNIFINWTYVGANGNVTYGPHSVLDRFPYCHQKPEKTGKTIFRPHLAYAAYCHYPHVIRPSAITRTHASGVLLNMDPIQIGIEQLASSENTDVNSATIYHYFTKSFDEFLVKCSRNAGGKKKIDGIDFSRLTSDYFAGFLFHYKANLTKTPFNEENLTECHSRMQKLMQHNDIFGACSLIEERFAKRIKLTKAIFREYLKTDYCLADKFNSFIAKHAPYYFD